jgi:predicted N-acetyltransferase YhbS
MCLHEEECGLEMDMALTEVRAAGEVALALASGLLQRARLADAEAGIWEAADVQWWWREPRPSDNVDQLFWVDSRGPVACVLLTSWAEDSWQCDPIIVPGAPAPDPALVWGRALAQIAAHTSGGVEVPVPDDDLVFKELVESAGFVGGESSGVAWMRTPDRLPEAPLPEGFILVDRTQRQGTPHPMRHRNGEHVEERLRSLALYSADLDLAVETVDGQIAGYSLYWFDPVTEVGLVEPVRVEDEYQRRGIARAMLVAGIDRLASKGAKRVKIGYGTEAAAALYKNVGFQPNATDTWYEGRTDHLKLGRSV